MSEVGSGKSEVGAGRREWWWCDGVMGWSFVIIVSILDFGSGILDLMKAGKLRLRLFLLDQRFHHSSQITPLRAKPACFLKSKIRTPKSKMACCLPSAFLLLVFGLPAQVDLAPESS